MVFKLGVLKNFAIFSRKHLPWSLFLIKLHALKTCNFIKKRLQHRCFPVNIGKVLRTPIFGEHLRMSSSEQSGFSSSKRCRNVTRTLSDKHTRRMGQFHYENEKTTCTTPYKSKGLTQKKHVK